jgi:hypothetical protein
MIRDEVPFFVERWSDVEGTDKFYLSLFGSLEKQALA